MGTFRPGSKSSRGRLPYMLLAVALLAALLFWVSPGGASIGFAPFLLILLLCPLVHMFMHRDHGSAASNRPPAGDGAHRH